MPQSFSNLAVKADVASGFLLKRVQMEREDGGPVQFQVGR